MLMILTCKRCGNEWVPRTEHPKQCPGCHSPRWQTEKRPKRSDTQGAQH